MRGLGGDMCAQQGVCGRGGGVRGQGAGTHPTGMHSCYYSNLFNVLGSLDR